MSSQSSRDVYDYTDTTAEEEICQGNAYISSTHSTNDSQTGDMIAHPFMDPSLLDVNLWNYPQPRIQDMEYISDLLFSPEVDTGFDPNHVLQAQQLPHFEEMLISDVSALGIGIPAAVQDVFSSGIDDTSRSAINFLFPDDIPPTILTSEATAQSLFQHVQPGLDYQGWAVDNGVTLDSKDLNVKSTIAAPYIVGQVLRADVSPTKPKRARASTKTKKNNTGAISKRKPRGEVDTSHRACWRCKRYKKPCNGKGSICDTCVTSGFRIWPSALGCRRGNLESFVDIILPGHAERIFDDMGTQYLKPLSYRKGPALYPSNIVVPEEAKDGDIWDRLKYGIQSTAIHGPGILELIDIAAKHQRSKSKPDMIMLTAAQATSLVVDLYHSVVSTGKQTTFDQASEFPELFRKTRKLSVLALDTFLRTSLVGRLKDWFPVFVGGVILIFSYILVVDAIAAIPVQHLHAAWPNLQKNVIDLRHYMYSTVQDLLSVLAKGSKLLDLLCWSAPEIGDNGNGNARVRNKEGMRMMDDDVATYDAMRELQQWRERFSMFLTSDSWMTTLPLTTEHLPVTTFARLFQFSNRG